MGLWLQPTERSTLLVASQGEEKNPHSNFRLSFLLNVSPYSTVSRKKKLHIKPSSVKDVLCTVILHMGTAGENCIVGPGFPVSAWYFLRWPANSDLQVRRLIHRQKADQVLGEQEFQSPAGMQSFTSIYFCFGLGLYLASYESESPENQTEKERWKSLRWVCLCARKGCARWVEADILGCLGPG